MEESQSLRLTVERASPPVEMDEKKLWSDQKGPCYQRDWINQFFRLTGATHVHQTLSPFYDQSFRQRTIHVILFATRHNCMAHVVQKSKRFSGCQFMPLLLRKAVNK